MALMTGGDITAISNNIISRAILYQRRATVMPRLVSNFRLRSGENQLDLPSFPATTMNDLTDGQDMGNAQDFTPSAATFTTAEAGGQVVLTDKALRQARDDVRRMAGEDMGMAMSQKIDTDIQGNFDSFTTNVLGSATTTLTLNFLLAGRARLIATTDAAAATKEPAPAAGRISVVLHTFTGLDIQQSIANAGTSHFPDEFQGTLLRRWWLGSVFGMGIFEGPYLTIASSAAKGAVFHERALVYVVQRAPYIEPERDASLRGWELNEVADFGHGIFKNAWGGEMHFASVVPVGTTS